MRPVLLVLAGICLMSLAFAKGTCPINSSTNVVVYGQTGNGGVGRVSVSWMTHFFNWWKSQDPTVDYTILSADDVKSNCQLAGYPNLKLYVQPGGVAYDQQNTLGQAGKDNILAFINSGKAYYGVCAGFYYAATDYYWEGAYSNPPYLLGKFPTVEGSVTGIADYEVPPGYAMTRLSNGNEVVYSGGPTRGWSQTPSAFPGTEMAYFTAIPGQLPAIIIDGDMLLSSVHLEAYENEGIFGLTTAERTENYKWLANMLNTVTNAGFYVPPYSSPGNQIDYSDGRFLEHLFFEYFKNGALDPGMQPNASYWAAAYAYN